ncbi:hypothetical protein EW146_g6691 [Bondarzewia mesenterica]|uniref:SUZ domain-containing protein n=1 Tax=Bondarzewia mesenterica TaxID=1095465 RepID=A0A4S4LTH5_9AGAM|nr:hypothetical protein EW146_g6691 [Bondarzewia mesenterica]
MDLFILASHLRSRIVAWLHRPPLNSSSHTPITVSAVDFTIAQTPTPGRRSKADKFYLGLDESDFDSEEYEMVQSYGTDAGYVGERERVEGAGESEGSALLAQEGTVRAGVGEGGRGREREGHATLTSSVSNLSNTIIGSGMLTFPLAMASAGVIPGMITCLFSGSVAAFGLYLLSACARNAPHRRASFFAVANFTFPQAAVFFDAAIAIKCFGVSISYLIIIKSLLPNVVASLYHDLTSPGTNPPPWILNGRNWITMLMVVLVPLSFLRRLDSLRHTSYIALFSVVYLVVIVIVCYFHPVEGTPAPGEIHLIKFTPNFVSTFPIQVFAFTCAQNLFPIFNEVVTNSQHRMNIIIGSSIGSATLTYEIIAVFGYLTFGSNVGANIIAMYPATSLFIAIGQLAIAILVLFSYPLQVHPCRNCLDKVFHWGAAHGDVKQLDGDEGGDEDEHGAGEMSALKHTLLTAAIIASGFTIAYFVDDLQMVLSFVGSTGSTTISFILPGLFYWKMTRNDPSASKGMNRAALALAAYGVFILVFWLERSFLSKPSIHIHTLTSQTPASPSPLPALEAQTLSPPESPAPVALMPATTILLTTRAPLDTSQVPPTNDATLPSMLEGTQILSLGSPGSPAVIDSEGANKEDLNADVDPQIIEALKSKDRLFVLRLGELIESIINDKKARTEVIPSTSYQRLLVHRCSTYYKVVPETDMASKNIFLHATSESKIPPRRISELVPAESTKHPSFQIMRRTPLDRARSKPQSRTGSVAGEGPDLSDVERSESGSLGGRSNAANEYLTFEQRAAAYNEARSRIFMNFEDKAMEKESDMSASSSTFSLVSGSASTSGGGSSSAGDLDDSVSSAATESEWSGPAVRDKKDIRRGSSRNSRAASPSFTYASLYNEPPVPTAPYDPSQTPGQGPQGYMQPYMYPYPPPPNQTPGQGYYQPYAYFAPYPYPPPQHPMSNSDPATPGEGLYVPAHTTHPQPVPYMGSYMWPTPAGAPQGTTHSAAPSPPHGAQYPPYAPAGYGSYPMTGYFPPPPHPHAQPMRPPMPGQSQAMYSVDVQQMNGAPDNNSPGLGVQYRAPMRSAMNGSGNGSIVSNGGQGKRGPPRNKSAWSYGPGIGIGGHSFSGMSSAGVGTSAGTSMGGFPSSSESTAPVGPRLSSVRRASGNSTGSTGNRTPAGDEASSTASSTSSSSRRTFTSTTSSQHPLPARPDWAVGLKAQPTLHAIRNHDHSNNHNHPPRGSPTQNGSTRLPLHSASAPVVLQSADFPPLGGTAAAEKRSPAPVPFGAWNNASSTRTILLSPPGQHASYSNALAGANGGAVVVAGGSRLDESDKAFERPPPKGNAELFNPKAGGQKRPVDITGAAKINSNGSGSVQDRASAVKEKEQEQDAIDGVVERMEALGVAEGGGGRP